MTTTVEDIAAARSLTALFRAGAEAHPDEDAVVMVTDPDREHGAVALTYRELDHKAREVAALLRDTCRPQDRVLLLYPSSVEFVAAFLGCLYAGVIAVPAPFPGRRQHRQQRKRLTGIATNAAVSLVLTRDRDRAAIDEWLADEGLDRVRCAAGDVLDAGHPGPIAPDEIYDAGPDTIAFLQYTSGSTGEPKGVVLTHRNLTYNIEMSARMARRRVPQMRMCSWLPLYHDMGLIGTVLSPLVQDGLAVLLDPMTFLRRPYLWLRTMDRYRATVTAAPSFAYALCTKRVSDAEVDRLDLSSVDRLYNGSERIDPAAMTAFAERFAPAGLRGDIFVPSYGLAEATLVVSMKTDYDPAAPALGPQGRSGRAPVSCGSAPYVELRIVDGATGEMVPEGQEGEIWLRGDSVSRGYWQHEEQTSQTFGGYTADGAGPYLRTGDLGLIDGGEIYVSGRIKEVIVIHGQKVFPQDIEQELGAQHPELSTGAVFALPATAEQGQDRIVIAHEVTDPSLGRLPALAHDVLHTAAKEFGAVVESVVFVRPGSIPRTTSGKVKRVEMRDLYLSGGLNPLYAHS
jgi:acyl-CoA synthetase (AMP-forming)/AMP-acid ligase II